jgi:uncharacterized protein involved in exopolysaccharide biosynthesis
MKKKKSKSKDFFESFDLVLYLYKRRYPILFLTFLGAVASIIASLMITPRYKSSVVFFPATGSSAAQVLIPDTPFSKEPEVFGEEEDVEQMLQVLNSDAIRSKVIEKYDLFNHYKIKKGSKYPQTALHEIFRKNVSFRKTEYMAVRIDVLDKDPDLAAAIANDIASLLDSTMHRLQKLKAKKALMIVEEEYLKLQKEIRSIEDSLNIIRRRGVLEYGSQANAYHQAYANALLQSNEDAARVLDDKLRIITRYGGAYVTLSQLLEFRLESLTALRMKYQEAQVNYQAEMPVKFILDSAYPAEKKSYPIRWLIVVISTLSVFVLSFFLFLLADSLRKKLR